MFARLLKSIDDSFLRERDPALGLLFAFFRLSLCLIIYAEFGHRFTFYFLPVWQGLFGAFIFATTTLLLLGIYSRAMAFLTGICIIYVTLAWGLPDLRHHHSFLLGFVILLLACTNSNSHFSLQHPQVWESKWRLPVLPLFQIQVITLYVFALCSKLRPGFFSGYILQQILMRQLLPSINSWLFQLEWIFQPLSILAFVTELTLVVLLTTPIQRVRNCGVLLGLIFHMTIYFLIPVSTFSILMAVLLLSFLDPYSLTRFLTRFMNVSALPKQIETHE